MGASRPLLKITTAEWEAVRLRGHATIVFDRPYIVMSNEATHEPVYQPVSIVRFEPHDGADAAQPRSEESAGSSR